MIRLVPHYLVSPSSSFFSSSLSSPQLIKEVEGQFIVVHFEIFHSECAKMIRSEMLQDFGRMYELLARVPEGVKPLLKILEDYVVEVGLKDLDKLGQNALKNPQEYFDVLLALHSKYMGIVGSSFKGDAVFSASIDKVCVNMFYKRGENRLSSWSFPRLSE